LFTPQLLIIASRKCLIVSAPVVPVKPEPEVGGVVSSVEEMTVGCGPESTEKFKTCDGPPV
jgi:hypothetical protein